MHLSDEYVLNHHSLDAYLYMRFLKVLTLMAFVGAIITWPILFPVNATGGGGESGLDILSFSNIENDVRYFALLFVVLGVVFLGTGLLFDRARRRVAKTLDPVTGPGSDEGVQR